MDVQEAFTRRGEGTFAKPGKRWTPERLDLYFDALERDRVIAAGDSYNDTTMLSEAHAGILFHAPDNVIAEFPQFPAVHTFEELKQEFLKASNRKLSL